MTASGRSRQWFDVPNRTAWTLTEPREGCRAGVWRPPCWSTCLVERPLTSAGHDIPGEARPSLRWFFTLPGDKLPDLDKRSWVVPALRAVIAASVGQPFLSSLEGHAAPDWVFRAWHRSTLRTKSPPEMTTLQPDSLRWYGAAWYSSTRMAIIVINIMVMISVVNMGFLIDN